MISYKCTAYQDSYKVWVNKRLKYAPYAQAGVLSVNNCTILVSYITPVLVIQGGVLWCAGLYSNTTRRHISSFLREYYSHISDYDIKAVAGSNVGIDTQTGAKVDAESIANEWYRGLYTPMFFSA